MGFSIDTGLDGLPDAGFIIGPNDRVLEWNSAAVELFGIPRDAAIDRTLGELVRFSEPGWRADALALAGAGKTWRGTLKIKLDGRSRFLDWALKLLPSDSLAPCTLETVRDITERVRAEQSLANLFDESPYVVSVVDLETSRFVKVSGLFCRYQHRRKDEIIGHTAEELGIVPPDNARELKDKLQSEGYLEGEEVVTTNANGIVSVGLSSTRLLEIDGRMCAVTAWQDVTELKRTETALREANERFDEAMAAIPVTIWRMTLDEQGGVHDAYVSPEADRILGLPEGTLRNDWEGLMARIHGEDQSSVADQIREAVLQPGARPRQVEYRVVRPDGGVRWIRTSGQTRVGEDGRIQAFGISEDITSQRQAAAERERLAQQLQQAQKLESLGRLAGGIAHDFNNILTAILGNLDLVMMQMAPGDLRLERLRDAQAAGRRAAELTRHLLALSRRKIIEPRVVDLNELVGNASRLLERLIGEDVRLRKALQPNLWAVKVDPSQIEQILINLAVNARDAMPVGGTLTLETAHVVLDDEYCETHPDAIVGPHVMLAVSDTGCGMMPEVKASIFEPFFTTKPQGQGTGLGLAMVHGLVRQHGGSIAFYSEPGQGTTFKVYLPAVDLQAQPLRLSTNPPASRGGAETILLVEDDAGVRRLASEVLVQLGYRILAFDSVGPAIEAAESHQGAIDLLLTDVILPDHNGRWLADRLRAMRPGIKVLFSSGYTANVIVHHGVLEEGIHFLEKPYTTEALAIAVRKVLDSGTP